MIDVPRLDSIDFDALVEEGRGLIPRFAPNWTDHNLHDPGITLLDLLAWLVDQQVYRIGFVSDAHLAAFAALLGVKPKGATPARGLIWARPGAVGWDQSLAARARAHPEGQPDLPFSVDRDVRLSAARIGRIFARRPGGTSRVHADERGGLMLEPDTEALELEIQAPGQRPDAEDASPCSLGLAYDGPIPGPAAAAPVAVDRLDGGGRWRRVPAVWTGAAGGSSGALLLTLPAGLGPVGKLRLRLDAGPPRRMVPVRIAFNAVPIVQTETLTEGKIGEGTGWPDLELGFDLEGGSIPESEPGFLPPVVASTAGGGEKRPWKAVADFSNSGPGDRHYVLDLRSGTLLFGNGINGRSPERGEEIFRAPLDVTLGAGGNVAAGTGWTVAGIATADGGPFGSNPEPVGGGGDSWSGEDLRTELRRRARLRRAMLTDRDLRGAALALRGFGIEAAEVLARYLPALPLRPVPGARTLLLRAAAGVANDRWLDSVAQALAPNRVLGERLSVLAVAPVEVDVEAELLVAAGSDHDRIESEARARVKARLAIGTAGGAREIEPWPSGRPVTAAEIAPLIAAVDGVLAVTGVRLARAGEPAATVSLPLARTEAAVAGKVRLSLKVGG